MKKAAIILISAFCLVAVGLTILMVYAICGGENIIMNGNRDVKLVNTESINRKEIDSVNISLYDDDVTFYISDTDEFIIKEYKNYTPQKDDLAKISESGNKLYIRGNKLSFQWICNRYGRVEVYLPVKFAGILDVSTSSGNISSDLVHKLTKLRIASTSGDIDLNEIYADEINVSASSGNITIQKAEGKRNISSTSGDIEVYSGSGDSSFSASSGNITIDKASGSLEADTNSGDIELHDSIGNKEIKASSGNITLKNSSGFVKASANSGDIMITDSDGAGDIKTTSGNIEMELTEVTDNINLEASSGDVTLKLPGTVSFNFTAKASSGDIETSFDDKLSYNKEGNHASGTIGNNPDKSVQINTTSGSISVDTN